MSRLVLQNLSKSFGVGRPGQIHALQKISISVEPGEFFVLLGPSGSGKSTLMRLVAGLETPTSGSLLWNGQELSRTAAAARPFALLLQKGSLLPHLTTQQNMELPLEVRGVPPAEREREVLKWAEALQVAPLLKRKPDELSGGEQQRISLARALIRNPEVLLLDEPLAHLDPPAQRVLQEKIRDIHAQKRTTIVYVTHDQREALSLADRIGLLQEGRLVQVGTPRQLYQEPVDLWTARFFSTPYFNEVKGSCDASAFLAGEFRHAGARPPGNAPVILGIRPEDILIQTSPVSPLKGTIHKIEWLGHESFVHFASLGHHWVARASGESHFQTGETISFQFRTEHFHWFDAVTGSRLSP